MTTLVGTLPELTASTFFYSNMIKIEVNEKIVIVSTGTYRQPAGGIVT